MINIQIPKERYLIYEFGLGILTHNVVTFLVRSSTSQSEKFTRVVSGYNSSYGCCSDRSVMLRP